jgi:UDP-N-acetylmuramoyl-L-alanyl-D-glutamate--2,6-diaminopimelate ligase
LRQVTRSAAGLHLVADTAWGEASFAVPFVGDFNVENLLTVLAMLLGSGVAPRVAERALANVRPPAGRMEVFGGRNGAPLVVVDYAHTPDALAKALKAAREHCAGRVWAVFGCGGDRDAGKRPVMGQIAECEADAIVLTDDNPRGESPAKIIGDIVAGLGTPRSLRIEHDRGKAIGLAIAEAGASDVVLVAGKGHEDYQIYGAERRPFSDQAAVRAALTRRAAVRA